MRIFVFLIIVLFSTGVEAKHRYKRDSREVHQFKLTHPCPAHGERRGRCPGYIVDHIKPICAGGEDKMSNMQWQEKEASLIKDREEKKLCAQLKRQVKTRAD